MSEGRYEKLKGETGREGMKNYAFAVQGYVENAYEMAVRTVRDMKVYSKGLGHMERAIQSLRDARGHVEDAMREMEG